MSAGRSQLILLALLAAWMAIAWPHLSEQFSTSERMRAAFGELSREQRSAALDQPGYRVAQDIAKTVPARSCVLVLSYTGPEHLRYYRSRFPYYLYPRQIRFSDHTGEPAGGCEYLAIFHDTPQDLAQEPFHGHWDEQALAQRIANMKHVFAGDGIAIFRAEVRR